MIAVLAGVSVAALVFAVVLLVRGRRVRLFGRALHRPRLWAAAIACLGVSGLLRLAGGGLPAGPRTALDIVLSVAFLVLLSTHLASHQRRR